MLPSLSRPGGRRDRMSAATWRRNLYLLAATVFVVYTGFAFVLPFLPLYVRQLGVEDKQATVLWAGVLIGVAPLVAGLMGFLHFMAGRFYWWPIHPLGLLLVPSYAILMFWWSIFLGWLLKVTILKYGGGGTFRKLRPMFIGLIIGDCLIGGLWIVVGLVRGGQIISIMPG